MPEKGSGSPFEELQDLNNYGEARIPVLSSRLSTQLMCSESSDN